MSECVFCDIVAKQAPASVVYEDDHTLGFMDLYPATTGHVIVIPKAHASNLAALPLGAEESIASAGRKIGDAMYTSLQCEGLNWVVADGVVAGQEIFHAHLHLVPRYTNDGFGFRYPPGYPQEIPRDQLDDTASSILNAL